MVSQTGRYALRTLGCLMEHEGEWIQGRVIAEETGIPRNYLSKLLNQLRKRGWVLSRKGWGGGFMLARRARRVPIKRVLELIEGRKDGTQCVFGLGDCGLDKPCPLHHHWERVQSAYTEMLGTVTIADLRVRDPE
jgi:Rrf2 family protein